MSMARGVIYLMTTVVPGLVKIGKTQTSNFNQRMWNLEHNGYCNVTALKREFAIEVEDFDEKEELLHNIFEKSRVSDTELFAVDKNIAIQLLSSFEGNVVYPKTETKESIFDEATDNSTGKLIPNGIYKFKKKKKSDNKTVSATAEINSGRWIIKKGSVLGVHEDAGGSQKARNKRVQLHMDQNGKLLEDAELGECSPSFAGNVVMNASSNGWTDWYNSDGQPVDIYRKHREDS